MSNHPDPARSDQLRDKAEELLRAQEGTPDARTHDADVRALIHELQVHQVELEMQNDELQRARAEAEEASERYQDLFDFAPVGYFLWDRESQILQVNLAGADLLGLSRSEVVQKSFSRFIAEEDRLIFADLLVRAMVADAKQTCEIKLLRNRDQLSVLIEAIGTTDRHGHLVVSGALIDITEKKRADDALRQAKAAAEQANHAKDHFLAVLSHELRTPLTPVVMGLSLLEDRQDLDPQTREILELVQRNVELEAQLIDDLLDVSRIARGKVELARRRVELHTVINRAIEVCKSDIEAQGLHLTLEFGPDTPYWIEADPSRLQQVFWNLLKNAIKFTPRDGSLTVRTGSEDDFVVAEVTDTGIGLEQSALSRIFNAFEQAESSTTRQFGGLGLGLAISKSLVEMHNGTITAESRGPGKGATFRVRLPLAVPAGPSEALRSAPERTPPLHILLVEDDRPTADVLRIVLSLDGHRVSVAESVAEAIELAGREPPDLLLTDLGLPDGSGYNLVRDLRLRGYTFPAIALTGYGQDQDIQRTREAGFAAHVVKPTSHGALVRTIAAVAAQPSAVRS